MIFIHMTWNGMEPPEIHNRIHVKIHKLKYIPSQKLTHA